MLNASIVLLYTVAHCRPRLYFMCICLLLCKIVHIVFICVRNKCSFSIFYTSPVYVNTLLSLLLSRIPSTKVFNPHSFVVRRSCLHFKRHSRHLSGKKKIFQPKIFYLRSCSNFLPFDLLRDAVVVLRC